MKVRNYLLFFLLVISFQLNAQEKVSDPMSEATFKGLKLRNVGPAFTSGRIADLAIHPDDDNVWYVAVGSGGVWKTENAGTTWQPIFDDQSTYSTGCITLDPSNPHTVWLGTGENVGGRHVAFGDGIYKSPDGGKTWIHKGLKKSEHISKIIVHPENSDMLWVAVQGPLWTKGGERGLYKTMDGGKTWKKTLGDAEWTGVTDIVIDPRNPDWLYAATWQRHRTVAAYLGGGPNSGIHRSTDGGETWEKLKTGLPKGKMGKIGLAISPQKPDVLYAAIELNRTKGGVYKSTNRGASWAKQSDAVSGATGPHYYQELYACPHNFDRLYLMDVRIQISDDGGKKFNRLSEQNKHSDNHAIAFRMDDPDYLLVGSDGGLYESLDGTKSWRFFNNMPITQYYKVAVDDQEPFYHIFGGTQDNGSHGGPSRTDNEHGIRNADWYKTLGADGHQSATEPGNPNIGYAETQRGGMHRIDRITGEQIYIQPQPDAAEGFERFNWDAPIIVSPHNPAKLYFASYRVWTSDDRGDSWTAISGDLTKGQGDRVRLPIMGKTQGWDNAWDLGAMSDYSTITSLAESPKQSGLVYAGTDDGRIQVTEDGGQNWRKIEVGSISGVPATAFVNDIKADLFDANTVYAAMDNHKYGDFKPYLLKSTDRGKTWKNLTGDLPKKTMVWRVVQDHVQPNLLFAGTEYGIYFTVNGGGKWMKLNGSPTIAFRDLVIQRRENDLVGASFGRSFFVLDDYSPLREITNQKLQEAAVLFQPKKTLAYVQRSIIGSYGHQEYIAPNPEFGATFTYYLKDGLSAKKGKMDKDAFPSWEELDAKKRADKPAILLTVKDSDGNIVRQIKGKTSKGIHRTNWDLRHASKGLVRLKQQSSSGRGFRRGGRGFMATPGTYSVTLSKKVDGVITPLTAPKNFEVVPLRKGALPSQSPEMIAEFRQEMETLVADISATSLELTKSMDKVKAMETALTRSNGDITKLSADIYAAKMALNQLDLALNGNQAKEEIGARNAPTIQSRMFIGYRGLSTTYGPTPTHRKSVQIAQTQLKDLQAKLGKIVETTLPSLEKGLKNVGAPMIEGQAMDNRN